MNDVKTILNLLRDGAFNDTDLTDSELVTLSNELGFGVYPIKHIYFLDKRGKLSLHWTPEELKNSDDRSSLYLTDYKSNLIVLPVDISDYYSKDNVGVIISPSWDAYVEDDFYDAGFISLIGRDASFLSVKVMPPVTPQSIVLIIHYDGEAEE